MTVRWIEYNVLRSHAKHIWAQYAYTQVYTHIYIQKERERQRQRRKERNKERERERDTHGVGYRLQTAIHWRSRYVAKRIHYGQLYKRLDAAALKLYARSGQADWIFRPILTTVCPINIGTSAPNRFEYYSKRFKALWILSPRFANRKRMVTNSSVLVRPSLF